jgi:hypothetical protein
MVGIHCVDMGSLSTLFRTGIYCFRAVLSDNGNFNGWGAICWRWHRIFFASLPIFAMSGLAVQSQMGWDIICILLDRWWICTRSLQYRSMSEGNITVNNVVVSMLDVISLFCSFRCFAAAWSVQQVTPTVPVPTINNSTWRWQEEESGSLSASSGGLAITRRYCFSSCARNTETFRQSEKFSRNAVHASCSVRQWQWSPIISRCYR